MKDKKYIIDTDENKAFLQEQAKALLDFGHRFPSPGGSSYYLGDDGSPLSERPRELWITCRMAHVYSIGAKLGHEGSKALAEAAISGIKGELRDTDCGGWYSGLMADGSPLPDKLCYAHAFVILAATSAIHAGVSGAEELLENALRDYDRFFWDEKIGLCVDTWDREFKRLDPYRGLNANMHTVEAFLAVADTLSDERSDIYRDRAGRIIDSVLRWAGANNNRIPEHYSTDWSPLLELNADKPDDPFKPYGATPGHGIEWARLITQWACSALDEVSQKSYIDAAKALYDRAIADAWCADQKPGIVYTTDWEGKPVVHDRMHWTLAEAINTSAVLYRVTGDEVYAGHYYEFMEYLDSDVIDHTLGSWIHQLDENNRPKATVWPGKPDIYHALQAMVIPYGRVDKSIAAFV